MSVFNMISRACEENQEEMKTYTHTKSFTWVFIAALFIRAPRWKQYICLSTDEWVNKM